MSIELQGVTVPVGTLWTRTRGARETASFEHALSWLSRRSAFGIDPELPFSRASFHFGFHAPPEVHPSRRIVSECDTDYRDGLAGDA